ncbi:MAG TPA: murein biosynthesis integral membrane protein MurJ [Candidatus Binataceae bacterium]|nr:murein biosynthesis integral membrane protein MurJ [Candidatus Binataceae bacterium]
MAYLVAAGILLSRIAGLVRESIFAHYLGNSDAADAFKAGFRIPNILQNLFGEGVLSASFIPIYSRLLSEGEEELAETLAWGVGAILALAVSILVALGVWAAPWLIAVIAPGFTGDKRDLTITLVRILFPGAGLLVLSAWCLGVLNSHHRFFASYAAPVAWNLAIIGALVVYGPRRGQADLALEVAWGAVLGAALQIAVQAPQTLRLVGRLRTDFARARDALGAVFRNLGPVIAGRGAGQISGYVDNLLASLLPTGAVAALSYARILYVLPISLFGMSVAAAELPSMSRASGNAEEIAQLLRIRLNAGLRQIAFLVVPSAAAFLFLGDVIAGLIFQSGNFTHADSVYVWAVLAGSAVGLLAATWGRLYNSAFYALEDTRTPLKFALIRFGLTLTLGYLCAVPLPPAIGLAQRWGVAGLSASAGLAAWVEFTLLRRNLRRRIGATGIGRAPLLRLWAIALAATAAGWAVKLAMGAAGPRLMGLAVLPAYGAVYLGIAWWLGLPELERAAGYLSRRLGMRSLGR